MKHRIKTALQLLIPLFGLIFALGSFGCGADAGGGGYGNSPVVPSGSISGLVNDPTLSTAVRSETPLAIARPVFGAAVFIEEYPSLRAVTGGDGSYVIHDVPLNQPVHLIVRHQTPDGRLFRTRSSSLSVNRDHSQGALNLDLKRADRSMNLVISDPQGNPVSGALVTIWGEEFRTDAQGVIALQMPIGTVEAKIRSAAYAPTALSLTFSPTSPPSVGIGLVSTGDSNSSPRVSLSASALTTPRNGQVVLTALANDPDNDPMTYSWSVSAGRLATQSTSSSVITWTAPDFDGIATISVEVLDGRGGRGKADLPITVGTGGANHPPSVVISGAPATASPGSTISLTAQGTDADTDPLLYTWSTTLGSLSSTVGTSTTWTAPPQAGTAVIAVAVSDGRGGAGSDQRTITIPTPTQANRTPVAAIVATSTRPLTGVTLRLIASGTDPDGDSLSYSWDTTAGAMNIFSGPEVAWTAPSSAGPATVTLIANDGRGGQTAAVLSIVVTSPVNTPPQVTVSVARTTTVAGSGIQVTAIGSDVDGDTLSYQWSAAAGSFGNSTASATTWTPISAPASITLRCTVSDGRGGSVFAEKQVQVVEATVLAVGQSLTMSVGSGTNLVLSTAAGTEKYGLILFPRNQADGTYRVRVNGGGSLIFNQVPLANRVSPWSTFAPRQVEIDALMRERGRAVSLSLGQSQLPLPDRQKAVIRQSETAVGDQHLFNVWNGGSGRVARTAELRVIGTTCKVFRDTAGYQGYDPSTVTDLMLTQFAQEFDSRIYPYITENYSNPQEYLQYGDKNGDQKISILFTPVVNGVGAAGFFDPEDLTNVAGSNQRDMFYMWVKDSQSSETWWKEATVGTLVHEFQHLANHVGHVLARGGESETAWLDEALSVGAETRYFGKRDERYDDFQAMPEVFSLVNWGGDLGNYGGNGLFAQYLFEQLGTASIKAMVQTTLTGASNVDSQSGPRGGFETLFSDWGLAMFRSGKNLPPDTRFDYRLDVALSLKTSTREFGSAFDASMTAGSFRFIVFQPGATVGPTTTLSLTDPENGQFGFSLIRLQ